MPPGIYRKDITTSEISGTKTISRITRNIFSFCAFYFFLMGAGLIFFPGFLVKGVSDGQIDPAVIGMLRGAGGSVLPYSLLYVIIAVDPYKRPWALYVILLANILAIILDFGSVIIGEYGILNAMTDVPVESLSIVAVVLLLRTNKRAPETTEP